LWSGLGQEGGNSCKSSGRSKQRFGKKRLNRDKKWARGHGKTPTPVEPEEKTRGRGLSLGNKKGGGFKKLLLRGWWGRVLGMVGVAGSSTRGREGGKKKGKMGPEGHESPQNREKKNRPWTRFRRVGSEKKREM